MDLSKKKCKPCEGGMAPLDKIRLDSLFDDPFFVHM